MPAKNPVKPASLPEDLVAKITEAMPDKPPAAPLKPRRLLVFGLTRGFWHGSIPIAARTFEIMGEKTGAFRAVVTNDLSVFVPERLREFDAVMMNNTTGDIFGPAPKPGVTPTPEQMHAAGLLRNLLSFVSAGGGLCGMHAATDWKDWDDYGRVMGAQFAQHPYSKVVCKNEDPTHPINAAFEGKELAITDEMYVFKESYTRMDLRILLSIDVEKSGIRKQARTDADYWVSWVRPYDKGRVFYCSLGHQTAIFHTPQVLRHYLAGIQYAMGDLKADDTPRGELPTPSPPQSAP
jgi:type 1 glutamine amidotransferase